MLSFGLVLLSASVRVFARDQIFSGFNLLYRILERSFVRMKAVPRPQKLMAA